MADYKDLRGLFDGEGVDLRNRIGVALSVKCEAVLSDAGATAPQKLWAIEVLKDPKASLQHCQES